MIYVDYKIFKQYKRTHRKVKAYLQSNPANPVSITNHLPSVSLSPNMELLL